MIGYLALGVSTSFKKLIQNGRFLQLQAYLVKSRLNRSDSTAFKWMGPIIFQRQTILNLQRIILLETITASNVAAFKKTVKPSNFVVVW